MQLPFLILDLPFLNRFPLQKSIRFSALRTESPVEIQCACLFSFQCPGINRWSRTHSYDFSAVCTLYGTSLCEVLSRLTALFALKRGESCISQKCIRPYALCAISTDVYPFLLTPDP